MQQDPDRIGARSPRHPLAGTGESRGVLEYVLAAAGVAAWLWCAFEIARTLLA